MVLYRVVFQAKPGKAADLVALIKGMYPALAEAQVKSLQPRIMTDISGPTDTVVFETTHESLAAVEQYRTAMFDRADATDRSQSDVDLVVSARNEYYTIEA